MAPAGTGRTIDPTMVPRKIASSRHDLTVIPAGTGAARMIATVAMTAPHRRMTSRLVSVSFAVCAGGPSGGTDDDPPFGEASEGPEGGGAGVTVIGPNMRGASVVGQLAHTQATAQT